MKRMMKRWQWWVVVTILLIPVTILVTIQTIGSMVIYIGEKLQVMDNISTPKLLIKFVRWGTGK